MSQCLDERALVELAYSRSAPQPAPSARRHLAQCIDCARRMRALSDDLAVVGSTLAAPAPPLARPARAPQPVRFDRSPVAGFGWAASCAVVALLAWIAIVSVTAPVETPATHRKVAGLEAGFRKVSAAIFGSHGAGDAAEFPTATELALVQAALDGSVGCRPAQLDDHDGCASADADLSLVLASQWR